MSILGNVSVIEVGDAKIEKDIEQKAEIEYSEIKTKILRTNHILHSPVDTKNPKWLNEQIEQQEQTQVSNKLSLHKNDFRKAKYRSILYLCGKFNDISIGI